MDGEVRDGFGAVLRGHRRAVRLTQEELAERADLSVRAIADMERGRTGRPQPDSVRRLAGALGLTGKAAEDFRRASRGQLPTAAGDQASWPAPPAGRTPVPWRPPPSIGHFAGRLRELAVLDQLGAATAEASPIAIIGGAGVGKTALALRWASQRAAWFPDGQFFVDLRGFDPAAPPLPPDEALSRLLDELGVPARDRPTTIEARAGMFRGQLAGRRALVIIDNARDSAQVRDLLPTGPGPLALITSRNRLTSLIAREGAWPFDLEVLPGEDAVALLAARIGPARAGAERAALPGLADACARLPLALNVAAAILLTSPSVGVTALAGELASARGGLDRLDAGDAASSARLVFSASYRLLTPAAARLFRLLGPAPGAETSADAAASLLATTTPVACGLLRELTDLHLLAERAGGRFGCHELLRAFALDRLAAEEEPGAGASAVQRMLEWYLRTADNAARAINPRRRHASLDNPLPEVSPLGFEAYEPALAWLDAERGNLVAAVSLAAERGQHEIAWKLPVTLWDLFSLRGLFDDWVATHRVGLASARKLGEKFGETWLLNNLSAAYLLQDRLEEAAECIDDALPVLRYLGNARGEASLLHNGGIVQLRQGRYDSALRSLETALAMYRQTQDADGEGQTRQSMGEAYRLRGDLDDALACYQSALASFQGTGNRFSESLVLIDIAQVHRACGQPASALPAARRAVVLSREVGHRPGEAEALALAGDLEDEVGQHAQARRSWRLAAGILEELGDARASELRARTAGRDRMASPASGS